MTSQHSKPRGWILSGKKWKVVDGFKERRDRVRYVFQKNKKRYSMMGEQRKKSLKYAPYSQMIHI